MDPDRLQRSLALYKGLVEVTALINGITDYAQLLPAILDVAKRVVGAEASALLLADPETGDLRIEVARGPEGEADVAQTVVPRGRGIAGWVREHGRGLLVPDAYADPRFYQEVDRVSGFVTRSILCVPLIAAGATIGVLQVLNPVGRREFEQDELEVLEAYASLAATALDKLRWLERQRQQARLEHELESAAEIQRSFLASELPDGPGLAFASHYAPARQIGGDFYEVVRTGPDEYFAGIGDVSGKGMPAALCMAVVLSRLRRYLAPAADPAEILEKLNTDFSPRTSRAGFVTLLLARIRPSSGELLVASAGHPDPILAAGSRAQNLPLAGGPPLGVLPSWETGATNHRIPPGATLCLYTDGLTESRDPEGRLLGRAPVLDTLASGPAGPGAAVQSLVALADAHRGPTEPSDDLTLLCLRRP